jgi:uncharacterized protein
MPVTPTYPGVYIQEVDSGSRTVTGVATAITAFIGRAPRGPANDAATVFDWGEFQKTFGGRARDLPMTYAVEDFFNNGGTQALIVRVCAGAPLGTKSLLDIKTDDPKYTLKTNLTGAVSARVFLTVVKSPVTDQNDPKFGTYTLTFRLGSATSQLVLATLADVPPEMVDMSLKQAKSVVGVSYDGAPLDPQPMAALLDALQATPGQFKGGSAPPSPAASYQAKSNEQQLIVRIDATTAGAWADELELSVIKRRVTDPATKIQSDTFTLVADHPAFENPYMHDFTDWAGLDALEAETGGILKADPARPADPVDKWVGKGVPLTRIPDGAGASVAMRVCGSLVMMASSPGVWGNDIGFSFDKRNITDEVAVRYADYGIDNSSDFWNVNVYYPLKKGNPTSVTETIGPVYLGTIDAPCRIDHRLKVESQYLAARAPVGKVGGPDLPLDPTLVGNPDGNKHRVGMLFDGGDGSTMSSDIILGDQNKRSGIYALDGVDLFNIMVVPPDPLLLGGDDDMISIYTPAAKYCADRRAILIADPLDKWSTAARKSQFDRIMPTDLAIGEITSKRSVFTYFPRVKKLDPERGNREMVFSASGIIAGIFSGTDVRRGVWKAPAGIEAGMNGVTNLEHKLSDMQNGVLNQVGVNVLRDFPIIGKVIWGSRTLAGADALSDDYKYLPVRRLTNYVEESLYRGTKFAVFEPNAEPLWASLRLAVGTFMADLARQGAFYDYFVRCDKSTTTQFDIDRGRVNVIIGMAPVKPAEFVILTIQQLAGQTAA